MGSERTEPSSGARQVTDPAIPGRDTGILEGPVQTKYLDLDHDGVLDAVQITETLEFEADGAEVVEQVRELDEGIGADGSPTTVTVTDTVTIDIDDDGIPDAAEVTTVTVHPAAAPAD